MDFIQACTHWEYGAKFLAQRRIRFANTKSLANHILCLALFVNRLHSTCGDAKLIPTAWCVVAMVDERQVLQAGSHRGDIPGLAHMPHFLLRTFRFNPDRNDKLSPLLLIKKLYTDVGHCVTPASICILTTLLTMHRTLQCSGTLAISQCIEILIRCKAVADRVENRGLAHSIYADQIRDPLKCQGIIHKVMPIDQANPT